MQGSLCSQRGAARFEKSLDQDSLETIGSMISSSLSTGVLPLCSSELADAVASDAAGPLAVDCFSSRLHMFADASGADLLTVETVVPVPSGNCAASGRASVSSSSNALGDLGLKNPFRLCCPFDDEAPPLEVDLDFLKGRLVTDSLLERFVLSLDNGLPAIETSFGGGSSVDVDPNESNSGAGESIVTSVVFVFCDWDSEGLESLDDAISSLDDCRIGN
jgi:hypothetical protein